VRQLGLLQLLLGNTAVLILLVCVCNHRQEESGSNRALARTAQRLACPLPLLVTCAATAAMAMPASSCTTAATTSRAGSWTG